VSVIELHSRRGASRKVAKDDRVTPWECDGGSDEVCDSDNLGCELGPAAEICIVPGVVGL